MARPACCPSAPGFLPEAPGAHLWLLADDGNPQGRATLVDAFEHAEDRYDWFTPWGAPPDVRSLAQGRDVVLVNVHVGGILRATALTGPWKASIDIHADVHQVISSGRGDGAALAATALGLAVSPDDGSTWRLVDDGTSGHLCASRRLVRGRRLVVGVDRPRRRAVAAVPAPPRRRRLLHPVPRRASGRLRGQPRHVSAGRLGTGTPASSPPAVTSMPAATAAGRGSGWRPASGALARC